MRSISGPISRHFLWLSDQDKERMKTILVKALLQESDKSIRDLLAETLQTAAVHEYPDRWPNLLPLLLTTIQSSSSSSLTTHLSVDQQPKNIQILNILWVHNALLAIRKIVKRYEYKLKEQRGPLDVDLAVELVSTYKLFRPHLDFLLYQVCFGDESNYQLGQISCERSWSRNSRIIEGRTVLCSLSVCSQICGGSPG
jgi:hypothetical protein